MARVPSQASLDPARSRNASLRSRIVHAFLECAQIPDCHAHQFLMKYLFLVFFAAVSVARAETLQQLPAEALRRNPELQVFKQSIAAAKGVVTTARTFFNPELTVAPGVRRTGGDGQSGSEFHSDFALSQLFKFPGKRALEIALAQSGVQATQLALEGLRFQMAAKVRNAFYDLLASRWLRQKYLSTLPGSARPAVSPEILRRSRAKPS